MYDHVWDYKKPPHVKALNSTKFPCFGLVSTNSWAKPPTREIGAIAIIPVVQHDLKVRWNPSFLGGYYILCETISRNRLQPEQPNELLQIWITRGSGIKIIELLITFVVWPVTKALANHLGMALKTLWIVPR